jgi:hypothetical protein
MKSPNKKNESKHAISTDTKEGDSTETLIYRVTVIYESRNCEVYASLKMPSLRKLVRHSESKFAKQLFHTQYPWSIAGFTRHDDATGPSPVDIKNDEQLHAILKETPSITLHATARVAETTLVCDALILKRDKDALALVLSGVDPWQRCTRPYHNPSRYGASAVHFAAAAGIPEFVKVMMEKYGAKLSSADFNHKTLAQYCDDGQLYLDANFMEWLTTFAKGTHGFTHIVTLQQSDQKTKQRTNIESEEKFLEQSEIGRRVLCMVRSQEPIAGKIPLKINQMVLVKSTQRFATVLQNALPTNNNANVNANAYWIRPYSALPFAKNPPQSIDAKDIVPYPYPVSFATLAREESAPSGRTIIILLIGVSLALAVGYFCAMNGGVTRDSPLKMHNCFVSVERCELKDQQSFDPPLELTVTGQMTPLVWQIAQVDTFYYSYSTDKVPHISQQWSYQELGSSDCESAAAWIHQNCRNTMHEVVTSAWFDGGHTQSGKEPGYLNPPVFTLVPKHDQRHPSVEILKTHFDSNTAVWIANAMSLPHSQFDSTLLPLSIREQLREQLSVHLNDFTLPSEYLEQHPNRAYRNIVFRLVNPNQVNDLEGHFVVLIDSDLESRFDIGTYAPADTIEVCATICLKDQKCTAVAYDRHTHNCQLKSTISTPDPVHAPNIILALAKRSVLPLVVQTLNL